jgi:hypothetical protein
VDLDRNFEVLLNKDREFVESRFEEGILTSLGADELVARLLQSEEYANCSENDNIDRVRKQIPTLGARKMNPEVGRLDTLTNGWQIYRRNSSDPIWITGGSARGFLQPIDLNKPNTWLLDENFLTNIRDKDKIYIKTESGRDETKNLLVNLNEVSEYPDNGKISYSREITQELNLQTLDQILYSGDKIKVPDVIFYNWQSYWDGDASQGSGWRKAFSEDRLPGSRTEADTEDKYLDQLIYHNTMLGIIEEIAEIEEIGGPKVQNEDEAIYESAGKYGDTVISTDADFFSGSEPFPEVEVEERPDVVIPPIAYRLARNNF